MDTYQIYTIEYERREASTEDFFLRDAAHQKLMMSYYVWAIMGSSKTVIVDTGYTEEVAASRGRKLKRCPSEGLKLVGIDPEKIEDVIITHFHWDHLGNHQLFPNATFYAQEKEMAFWNSRYANVPVFRDVIEPDDITAMVSLNLSGRLRLISGMKEIFPGIRLHWVGGHTSGIQIVEVKTTTGTAVIASDAVKTHMNLRENIPDPYLNSITEMLDAYDVVRSLADDESMVLTGHDVADLNRLKQVAEDVVLL